MLQAETELRANLKVGEEGPEINDLVVDLFERKDESCSQTQGPWTDPSTAGGLRDLTEDFEVTHPFHILHGERFPLVSYSNNWAEDRVLFRDPQGRLRSIPAAWISVATPDPFVTLSAGRSLFRLSDLVALSDLIAGLASEARREPTGRVRRGGVK